jgi:pimeloyl-ACP methyl ester carboxylesterase
MKTPVIFLPGLMCDAAVWAPQVASLSSLADCLVLDYGLRDSLTDMAQQALDSSHSDHFALVGHSMGGRVALEVMRLAPERVQRLALLNTGTHPFAPGTAGDKEKAARLALLELARRKGMRVMSQQWLSGMVHPSVRGTALFESMLDMLERSSQAQYAAQIKALLNRPDAAPVLPSVACPTLVLTGQQDAWSPPAQHEAMCQRIPGATLCLVPECGHMSTLEQPAAVNQALATWLAC